MLTQHLQKLIHAVTVQRTFPKMNKCLHNAPSPPVNGIWPINVSPMVLLKIIHQKNKHKHSWMCWDSFHQPKGTQASTMASNMSFFYTEITSSRGRWRKDSESERISVVVVRVPPCLCHSENPWQWREKRRLRKVVRDICALKTTWTLFYWTL